MSYARTATLLSGMIALLLGGAFAVHGLAGIASATGAIVVCILAALWMANRAPGRRDRRYGLTSWPGLPLAQIVRDLSVRAGIAPPRLYLIDDDGLNAFASGCGAPKTAIGVTSGLLTGLSESEVRGVLAHEIAHVARRDARALTASATALGTGFGLLFMVGYQALGTLRESAWSTGGLLAIATLGAAFAQMAVSRQREFAADRIGAELCGAPLWIAAALERIETLTDRHVGIPRQRGWALESLRFGARREQVFALLSTHPTTSERIRRLRQQAGLADPWV
jgi:heat shock protein HtpX